MIAAALLHDVVEDAEASIEDVQARFGEEIAQRDGPRSSGAGPW